MDQAVVSLLRRTFQGRRVLVTGDTGFKGSWLCEWLLELGAEVTGYALPAEPGDLFGLLKLDQRLRHVDGDVRDLTRLLGVFQDAQPEVVFHLAAQPLVRASYEDPKLTFDTNVGGAVNLLEAVRHTPSVRSLVFVTSDKCYRNREWSWGYRETDELGGRDPYSASKAAAEVVFAAYNESFFALRPELGAASARAGNSFGGGDWARDRLVPTCIRALMNGDEVRVRNPDSVRPWQHVLDPLSGYLLLAARLFHEPRRHAGAWNFGPDADDLHTVGDVARAIVREWGSGTVGRRIEQNPPPEVGVLRLASDKSRDLLGWTPQWDFDHALRETVAWYREVAAGADAMALTRRQLQAFVAGTSSEL